MMKKTSTIYLKVVFTLLFSVNNQLFCLQDTKDLKSQERIIEGQNKFSWALFSELNKSKKNVFFSPYSIYTSMAMAYLGSKEKTHAEIAKLFRYPEMEEASFCRILKELNGTLAPEVHSLNAIALDTTFTPDKNYLSLIREGLGAEVFSVDFQKKQDLALKEINQWVNERTDGEITDLLHPQDVSNMTKMILLNAADFQGEWLSPFDVKKTEKSFFLPYDKEKIPIGMMQKEEYLFAMQDDSVSVVIQDFKHTKEDETQLECLFIMPRSKDFYFSLSTGISESAIEKWKSLCNQEYVHLYLPKFTLNERLELKELFKKMGMVLPFSNVADFSKISSKMELFIQQIYHQTFLQIKEQGLKASAATAVVMNMKSLAPTKLQPVTIRFDKPFYLVIYEKNNHLVLFMGKIEEPKAFELENII